MEHILCRAEEITNSQVISCLFDRNKTEVSSQENGGYSFEHNLISSGAYVGTKKCP
jgi:hypothetical protein